LKISYRSLMYKMKNCNLRNGSGLAGADGGLLKEDRAD
jgi:hypothetical protein